MLASKRKSLRTRVARSRLSTAEAETRGTSEARPEEERAGEGVSSEGGQHHVAEVDLGGGGRWREKGRRGAKEGRQ